MPFSPRRSLLAAGLLLACAATSVAAPVMPHAGDTSLLVSASLSNGTASLASYNGGIGIRHFVTPTLALRPTLDIGYTHRTSAPDRDHYYRVYDTGDTRLERREGETRETLAGGGIECILEKHPRRGATLAPFFGVGLGESFDDSRLQKDSDNIASITSGTLVIADTFAVHSAQHNTGWRTTGLFVAGVELGLAEGITLGGEYRMAVSYARVEIREDDITPGSPLRDSYEEHRFTRQHIASVDVASWRTFLTILW